MNVKMLLNLLGHSYKVSKCQAKILSMTIMPNNFNNLDVMGRLILNEERITREELRRVSFTRCSSFIHVFLEVCQ